MKNTVTQEQVEAAIADTKIQTIELVGKLHTLVAVRLQNGFTIVETSTCVDPDNYNEDLGSQVCISKIMDKIWMLEGYMLQTILAEED